MSISFCRYFSKNQFWNSFEHLNATDNGKCSFLQILQIFLQKKSRSVSQEFWNESAVQLDDPYIDHFVAEETSLKFPFKFMNIGRRLIVNTQTSNIWEFCELEYQFWNVEWPYPTNSCIFQASNELEHQHFWTNMSWAGIQ